MTRKEYCIILILILIYSNVIAQENSDIIKGKIYQTEIKNFNNEKGWIIENVSQTQGLYIGFYSDHIFINQEDPIKIIYDPLEVTTDNENVITQEANATLHFLDSDKLRSCRISLSNFKNSGLKVLHIFFIKEKWLSFYFTPESNVNNLKNDFWSLETLTLPFKPVTINDAEVTMVTSIENKVAIYNNFERENANYRASITFSSIGLSSLIYDKNGGLVIGIGKLGPQFYLDKNESSSTMTKYTTGKVGSINNYTESEIIIMDSSPYSNSYSLIFSYSEVINNQVITSFLIQKSSFETDYKFRIF